jgi:DNA-binding response OmpR family regulator
MKENVPIPVEDIYKMYEPAVMDFSFQPENGVVLLDSRAVKLTPLLNRLLGHLMSRPGEVVSERVLLQEVWQWGVSVAAVVSGVVRLRRAIEPDPKNPRLIVNRHGLGYVFVPPTSPEKD